MLIQAPKGTRDILPSDINEWQQLEQKFFSFAEEAGFGNLVEFDQKYGEYFQTAEYEETTPIVEFITEFEDHNFWHELISRLSDRDFLHQEGLERAQEMSLEERILKVQPIEQKYSAEFEANGLENIAIRKSAVAKNG